MNVTRKIGWQKVLLVTLIILIAYGQTLLMYFWQDDSALIFKLMNPEGPAGSFGSGIIGNGAYKYLVTWYVPFFSIFGKEPFGYFLVGLLTYGLATLSFYFFAKNLFDKKKAAFFATLIFAAGYVGGDTMFRIINSWQTNIGLILVLVTLGIYIKYLKTNKFLIFLFSVFLFWLSIEFVFIRSHSLVFAVIILDFVYRLLPFDKKRLTGFFVRQIPFLFIFHNYYLSDSSFTATGDNSIFQKIFSGDFVVLSPFFANLGNVFIPNEIQLFLTKYTAKLFFSHEAIDSQVIWFSLITLFLSVFLISFIKIRYGMNKRSWTITLAFLIGAFFLNNYFFELYPLWYRNLQTVFAGSLALFLSIVFLYLSLGIWKKDRNLSRALIAGIVIAATQFSAYFLQYQTSIFATHHRYFSHTIIGTSLIWGVISYLFILSSEKSAKAIGSDFKIYNKGQKAKKVLSLLPLFVVISGYLYLGVIYQRELVLDRSKPSRAFYQDLLEYVPEIEKGAAFYFDVSDIGSAHQQFGDFFSVGSMPDSTALAMYYDVDRYDLFRLTDYDELLYKLSTGEIKLENTYSFFVKGYDFRSGNKDGLINTTNELRKLLSKELEPKEIIASPIAIQTVYQFNNDLSSMKEMSFSSVTNVQSIVPTLLSIKAKLSPASPPTVFPFVLGNVNDPQMKTTDKVNSLSYLAARKKYFEDVKAESSSEWKYREVRNVVDDNDATVWQGHRIWWHDKSVEDLTIDLGEVKLINKYIWKNWKTVLAPIDYEIQISVDGENWKKVKKVSNGPERKSNESVVESFESTKARFVRMHITKVQTQDSPGIVDVEVVESKFSDIDTSKALVLSINPFYHVESLSEWNLLYDAFSTLATMEIVYRSDASNSYSNPISLPVSLDGNTRNYEVVIPAGGTQVSDINVSFSYPVAGTIESISAENLTIDGLSQRSLIKDFKEN